MLPNTYVTFVSVSVDLLNCPYPLPFHGRNHPKSSIRSVHSHTQSTPPPKGDSTIVS